MVHLEMCGFLCVLHGVSEVRLTVMLCYNKTVIQFYDEKCYLVYIMFAMWCSQRNDEKKPPAAGSKPADQSMTSLSGLPALSKLLLRFR